MNGDHINPPDEWIMATVSAMDRPPAAWLVYAPGTEDPTQWAARLSFRPAGSCNVLILAPTRESLSDRLRTFASRETRWPETSPGNIKEFWWHHDR